MSQNEANLMVQDYLLDLSADPKTKADIEKNVLDDLMYDEENHKRPVGYRFGVDRNGIFGVKGVLRKRCYSYTSKKDMEMKRMKEEMQEQKSLTKLLPKQVLLVLNVVGKGPVSNKFLDVAKLAVAMVDRQAPDASSGYEDVN